MLLKIIRASVVTGITKLLLTGIRATHDSLDLKTKTLPKIQTKNIAPGIGQQLCHQVQQIFCYPHTQSNIPLWGPTTTSMDGTTASKEKPKILAWFSTCWSFYWMYKETTIMPIISPRWLVRKAERLPYYCSTSTTSTISFWVNGYWISFEKIRNIP